MSTSPSFWLGKFSQYRQFSTYNGLIYNFSNLQWHKSDMHLVGTILQILDFDLSLGFPGGASGKDPACQCRRQKRLGCEPWVGKIPWRREW